MDTSGQLKLLLWKDFLIRKRHLGVATLVFGWAIAVFLVLYIVRESVEPEYIPTCQYKARSLPSTGLFPFVQSFICNVDNKCGDIHQYEEVPQYKEAKLTGLASQLQSVFTNDTITDVIKSLPNMLDLLQSIGEGLDSPDLEGIFGSGVRISNLFDNPPRVKERLLLDNTNLKEQFVDLIFKASLKFGKIFQTVGSTDINSILCDPNKIEKYLIVQNLSDIEDISSELCRIEGSDFPKLLENTIKHVDLSGLIKMIETVLDHFKNYNVFEDISSFSKVVLNLNSLQPFLPSEFKLKKWVPEIIPLMQNLNRTYFDASFVNKSIEIINPYFSETELWPAIKELLLKFSDSIETLQNYFLENMNAKNKSFTNLDLEQKLNIFRNFINELKVDTADFWLKIANFLDIFTQILNNNSLNKFSEISYVYSEAIFIIQNMIRNKYDSEEIIYNISEKHSDIISTVLSLGPEFSKILLDCFENITCTSILIHKRNNISEIFCNPETIQNVLPNAVTVKNVDILCNVDFSNFVNDAVNEFNLDRLNETIYNTNRVGNFTSAVLNTVEFVDYVKKKPNEQNVKDISWETLFPSIHQAEPNNIILQAQLNRGSYLFNLQFCYFKEILQNRTDLNRLLNISSTLMNGFFMEYKLTPVRPIISNFPNITEALVKQFFEKEKPCQDFEEECNLVKYINFQTKNPWYYHPIFTSIYKIINQLQEPILLNWDELLINAQNLYYIIEDLIHLELPKFNWTKMEIFKKEFWKEKLENDPDMIIWNCVNLGLEIIDFVDMNFDISKFDEIERVTTDANRFHILMNDIVELTINANSSKEIEETYPEIHNLSQIIVNSLSSIEEDFSKVKDLTNFKHRNNSAVNWIFEPCNKDVTIIFDEFKEESKKGLQAYQDVVCNGTKFESDLKTANMKTKISNFNTSKSNQLQSTVLKYEKILYDIQNKTKEYQFLKMESVRRIVKTLLDLKKESFNEKDTINQVLVKFQKCKNNKTQNCDQKKKESISLTMRFILGTLNEVVNKIRIYLKTLNDPRGVDPIALIGFKNNSAIYHLYLKFPDYIKLFINSYRSPEFELKIAEKRTQGKLVRCVDVMNDLIIPNDTSITEDDIKQLARYFCPSLFDWPVLEDNVFLAILNEVHNQFLLSPTYNFETNFATLSNNLKELRLDIMDTIVKGNVNITELWNREWLEKMKSTFYDIRKLNFTINNTITRFFKYIDVPEDPLNISTNALTPYGFGEFTYVLQHITESLNKFMSYNLTESDEEEKEAIAILKDLVEVNTKEVAGILAYAYFRSYHDDSLKEKLQYMCSADDMWMGLDVFLPNWMMKDENQVMERLCNITYENITDALQIEKELSSVQNYDVYLEDVVIQFISTFLNFVNNDTTIHLSSTLKTHFNLNNILNGTYPTDEELRNSSLIEADRLHDISHHYKIRELNELLHLTTQFLRVLDGGDWWSNMINHLEAPVLTIWFRILERFPYIVLHLTDLALTPHFLSDLTEKLMTNGIFTLCSMEFDNYLHKDNIAVVVQELCHLKDNTNARNVFDSIIIDNEIEKSYNETKMAENIYEFEKTLINLMQSGPKTYDLPKWLNETEILKEYKKFETKSKQPLNLLQNVITILTETADMGYLFYRNESIQCDWCSWGTTLAMEIKRQLQFSQQYVDLVCNLPNMKFEDVRKSLVNDFKWGEFYYDILHEPQHTVKEFNREIHDIIDVVRLQLVTFYTNKTLRDLPEKCMKNLINLPQMKNITTYIKVIPDLIHTIKTSTITYLNATATSKIFDLVKEDLQIYKPLKHFYWDSYFEGNLEDSEFKNSTIKAIMEANVDINLLIKIKNRRKMKEYLKNYYDFTKLYSFKDPFVAHDVFDEISSKNITEMTDIFYGGIRRYELNEQLTYWRDEAGKTFDSLVKIFEDLEAVLLNGGDILEFLANIDFNTFIAERGHLSSLFKGILDIVQNKSIEKLFISFRDLIQSSSILIKNKTIENDLYALLDGVENLSIFKNLGLLRLEYNVGDLFRNPNEFSKYLVEEMHIEETVIENIFNASIDLTAVIVSQKNSTNMQDLICDPKKLTEILNFDAEDSENTASYVSDTLCQLNISNIRTIAEIALKNMNFTKVLNEVMNSTVNHILTSAHMTETEGKQVVKNIGTGVEILPVLKSMMNNVSAELQGIPKFEKLEMKSNGSTALTVSPDFLSTASQLLCGRSIAQKSNKLYKTISETKDFNGDKYDAIEEESLPTQFCRNVYKDIVDMDVGKILWSYIKPLIRGEILYTPKVPYVTKILEKANSTFDTLAGIEEILLKITKGLTALDDKEKISHYIENIQNFMNSSIVKMAIQNVMESLTNSKDFSLDDINLEEMLNSFGDSNEMSSSLRFASDMLRCVKLKRFVGFDTEQELEEHAKYLMQRNEFIAGVVFLNMDHRMKRSVDIPENIAYKIRTDVDSVPSTNYLKYKFWTPGPDSDFLDDLRYFRGFIQLQDLIDNAIIKVKALNKELPSWEVLTQQIPYPCWTNDFFKSALNISQTFQVCFFFGLIVIVAAAVRYIVWEKESGNTMVMNVMGLRYHTHCLSWFIVTFIEMLIVMVCILAIIKFGGILPMTDAGLLFLYLIEFGFSVIMFCYMISSIFNSASLAAVGSAIFYLLSFMPYIIIISLETTLPFWAQILTNLSMSTSFCYGCLYIIRFELQGVGLQWNNNWDTPVPGDNMNFGVTCIFLIVDGFLYWLIGYLCSRKTQELQDLFSLFPSSKLCTSLNLNAPSYVTFENEMLYNSNSTGDNYLDNTISSTNIVNDEPVKIGVTIRGLTKIYNSRKKTVKAIEDIDITLYTGQVTTLLGHNGAGKTTLIKILTGMMEPTNGQIIINREITECNNKSTRYLGVCPQASVLINTMSAVEHLIFYAKLKTSRSTAEVLPEVASMIDNLSLGLLSNEPVSHLSEGMRRRLCVAIAFIGNPKLVVLDEPSSGVDPIARRQIWDLVIRYKEGCTVLLTTHYLDEAELLSDRVVVLHKGKVLCSGSPSTLKQSYGTGYKIIVTYPETNEKIESNEDYVLSIVKTVAPNTILNDARSNTINLIVPFNSLEGTANNFEQVAKVLEDNQSKLGFSTFSMNCTTLEQVFLDLCASEDSKSGELKDKNNLVSKIGHSYTNVFSNSVADLPAVHDDDSALINTGEKITGNFLNKFCALLKKRAIHYIYDWRVIVCALVLPTLFTAVAMGFSLIRPPNSSEPSLKLTPNLYEAHTTSFISVETEDILSFVNQVSQEIVSLSPREKNLAMYNKTYRDCKCMDGMQKCAKPSYTVYDSLLKLPSSKETVHWLVDTQDEYIERRYGGWSLSEQPDNKSAFIVWYNNKGYHAMPAYLNTMNNAILRTVSPRSSITTFNHPLKLSVDQLSKSTIAQHIADVGIAMVLLIAFSLIPASGAIYLVQERVNEEKRLQFLCGVSPTLYWIVAFIWDMIVLLCALVLAVIVFKIFNLPVYVAKDNLAAVSLLIFLYGWACIPFIHLAQRFFTDASMANMILFCSCAFIGISELTCLLLMDILGKTQFVADFRDILHKIYILFPQFVLGDGLVEISKNNILSEILQRFHMDTYVSPLSWELMGSHYLSLFIVGIILFMLNLIIENQWYKTLRKSTVTYESDSCCLETINLSKEYKTLSGKHKAVNKVSLKVPFGQCLGLIGVNGAGKSTTFKMLTTELRPTSGRIFFQGREIGRKPLFTGEMGYCPQCDSIDPKLTVSQTLGLYLTLRGIENMTEVLNKIMLKFELTEYANRRTENLSGGNKRKLCTALSVLGKTSLILMDEPTSGMDPYSRNLVGVTIQQLIKQNRSVILTSHSVEDCENLCSIVAVMINGEVICRGSPQELKERFGSGYIITVRLSKSTEQEKLLELIQKHFPGAELMSQQYCSSQFTVPTDQTRVSEMFNKMTEIAELISVEDYNLVQSSLDQVFINLANKNKEISLNNEESKSILPDMYSMDVL